ncbi:MAG: hypothetical protein LUG51_12730 [Tannerellaceae bacterium]|nr:hypothetical protein [Tannerellaceae bacterium]
MNRGYLFSFLLIFLITWSGYGQLTTGGLPPSFLYETGLKSTIDKSVRIPVNFNTEDLKLVDEWKTGQGAPLRIATLIPTDLSIENAGEWSELPGGEKIWQLHLQAKDATAIMLYYNAFYIPEGGQLFIYNVEKTHVLGAYTHITNPLNGKFVTEFVAGDEIILEYVAAESGENPRIEIESIGYGYNHLTISLRSSGSCMVNINCDEGDAWQNEKRGICRMIQRIGRNSYYCTGSLVNNTAEDLSPYILTAYHCMEDDLAIASDEDLTQWMFYFNYESNACSGTATATGNHILIGCTRKVAIPLQGGSDGLLLLLQSNIPESFDVYYNGWDRREVLPQFGVNIHHPQGDIKKISTFTQPATDYTWVESGGTTGATSAHFNIIFSKTVNGYGVTEGGSSGSPLFNENKLVVGTLTGGNSSCNYLNGLNVYGKFSFHWNKYGTDISQRMDVWLDPLNKGVETLNGMNQLTRKAAPDNLSVSYSQQQVVLEWKAPTVDGSPSGYYIYRDHTFFGSYPWYFLCRY